MTKSHRRRFDLHAVAPHRCDDFARRKQLLIHHRPALNTSDTAQRVKIVQQHDIGAFAGRDHPAILQPECLSGCQRGGAIRGKRSAAKCDQRADHVVEMTLLGDVERVAVIGAQSKEG